MLTKRNTHIVLAIFVIALFVLSGCGVRVMGPNEVTEPTQDINALVNTNATQKAQIDQMEQQLTKAVPTSTVKVFATTAPTSTKTPDARPTATSTAAPRITSTPTAQATVVPGKADVGEGIEKFETGAWKVTLYEGATDQMRNWFKNIKNPAPASWPVFPNVNNPLVNFQAKNGLEYGLDERNYCPQETCDVVVAAGEYNGITADYDFGFLECFATETMGCGVMFVDVGEVSANFEQVVVNNGFSVAGRYWNGNELQQAVWGFVSHASANMLNMPTTLNPQGSTNAGANCSVKTGCKSVLWRVVITSGNQVLAIAETTVNPTSK